MAGRGISAPAVALAAGGAVVLYAGLQGISLASGLRTLLSGKPLPLGAPLPGLTGSVGGGLGAIAGGAVASVTGENAGIASQAVSYMGEGHVYKWGGGNPSGWDCSGFCNYVIGHDLGLAIPGYGAGKFTGSSHGPVTEQWAVSPLLITIPRAQVQAGDLCIWPAFHMGIAVDNNTMINCPGPNGTPAPVLHAIAETGLGPLVCRRLKTPVISTPPGAAL